MESEVISLWVKLSEKLKFNNSAKDAPLRLVLREEDRCGIRGGAYERAGEFVDEVRDISRGVLGVSGRL